MQDVSPQPRRNDGGPVGELKYRFRAIVLSPHDHNTVYFGSNVVFKSTDLGKTWNAISPDLTTNDPEKQKSVGTDDGNLQLTRDGGKSWTNLTGVAPGVPKFAEIAWIEPSRTAAGTAYVAFEHHWFDDFHPYLYKTTDFGKTFTSIGTGLQPDNYLWVVKEDPKNPRVLYAGGELGLQVSFDGGAQWTRMHLKNLPPVAIRDIIIHPRENDLILGTHGRSIWILDDTSPLQQITPDVLAKPAHLFGMRAALRFDGAGGRGGGGGGIGMGGNKPFAGPNPPFGAPITYYLKDRGTAKIEVLDTAGKLVRDLGNLPLDAGLNRVVWDLRYTGPKPRRAAAEGESGDPETGGRGFPARGPLVLPGKYTVRLTAAGTTQTRELEVKLDPTIPVTPDALRTQLDINLKLRDMQSAVNDALRGIDTYKSQLDTATQTTRALDPAQAKILAGLISERMQQLTAMELKLARPNDIPGYSMSA
jgi:hypothetical protein